MHLWQGFCQIFDRSMDDIFWILPVALVLLFGNLRSFRNNDALKLLLFIIGGFFLWRWGYSSILPQSGGSRYFAMIFLLLLIVGAAGVECFVRLVQAILSRSARLTPHSKWVAILLTVGLLSGIGAVKILRTPPPRTYLTEAATLLNEVPTANGILIDCSSAGGRLDQMLSDRWQRINSTKNNGSAAFWRDLFDYLQKYQTTPELWVLLKSNPPERFAGNFKMQWDFFPLVEKARYRYQHDSYVLYRFDRQSAASAGYQNIVSPENIKLQLPEQIKISARGPFVLKFDLPPEQKDNFYIEIRSPYGRTYGDGWYFMPETKPPEKFSLEIRVLNLARWELTRSTVKIDLNEASPVTSVALRLTAPAGISAAARPTMPEAKLPDELPAPGELRLLWLGDTAGVSALKTEAAKHGIAPHWLSVGGTESDWPQSTPVSALLYPERNNIFSERGNPPDWSGYRRQLKIDRVDAVIYVAAIETLWQKCPPPDLNGLEKNAEMLLTQLTKNFPESQIVLVLPPVPPMTQDAFASFSGNQYLYGFAWGVRNNFERSGRAWLAAADKFQTVQVVELTRIWDDRLDWQQIDDKLSDRKITVMVPSMTGKQKIAEAVLRSIGKK